MIIFRCSADPRIGYGHLTRCRAIAIALSAVGKECMMVGPEETYRNQEDLKIFKAWKALSWRDSESDSYELINLAKLYDSKLIILDDYKIDENYQISLLEKKLKWVQFQSEPEVSIWANLVVNSSPFVKPEYYARSLRNPNTKLLLGPKYSPLRPEFYDFEQRDISREVKNILVTFGAGDDRGAIISVLSILLPTMPENIFFTVLSGRNNPRNQKLISWVKDNGKGRVNVIIDPPHVATIYYHCDMAIMAGGSSTHEAACCGLPMILMSIAQNQISLATSWERLGIARWLGCYEDLKSHELLEMTSYFVNNTKALEKMRIRGRASVDGRGAQRICQEIVDLIG